MSISTTSARNSQSKRMLGLSLGIGSSALVVVVFVLLGSGIGAELAARTGSVRLIFLGLGGLTLDHIPIKIIRDLLHNVMLKDHQIRVKGEAK